jgi:hypothetical protein
MRRSVLAAIAIAALVATLLADTSAGAGKAAGKRYRWDLVGLSFLSTGKPVVTPGGTTLSKDANSGDELSLTGSGQFKPSRRQASGGGTLVHKHADGSEVAHGVYSVTGFVSYRRGFGTAPPVADYIGSKALARPADGILKLNIRVVPEVDGKPGPTQNATLSIFCHFEKNKIGLKEKDEGVEVKAGQFDFRQEEMKGFTVFHELR